MTTSFPDPNPLTLPIIFTTRQKSSIGVGQYAIPVNFSINSSSSISSMCVSQNGAMFSDVDIYSGGVIYVPRTTNYQITLSATSTNLATSSFYLRLPNNELKSMSVNPNKIGHIRSDRSSQPLQYTFYMDDSTRQFLPVSGLYPSASLNLTLDSFLSDRGATKTISLPNHPSSIVAIANSNVVGVMNILATLRIDWFSDLARTIKVNTAPISVDGAFGIKVYVSESGLFLNSIIIQNSTLAVAGGLYPTDLINSIGDGSVNTSYWSIRNSTLSIGKLYGIVINDVGMPIQGGVPVSVYDCP